MLSRKSAVTTCRNKLHASQAEEPLHGNDRVRMVRNEVNVQIACYSIQSDNTLKSHIGKCGTN